MKIEITVPAAGESVTEADIAEWSKSNGDIVEMDEVLLELETDKASLELTAEAAGKLEILVEDGETVLVGQVIGIIDTDAVSAEALKSEESTSDTTSSAKVETGEEKRIDIIVPAAGESVQEADIAEWSKESGDVVEMDDVLLELETDKASLELTAEASGTLTILIGDGETVKVGQVIGFIMSGGSVSKSAVVDAVQAPVNAQITDSVTSDKNYATGTPSPVAAKMMAENNISLDSGSGKNGRITKADVANELAKPKSAPATQAPKVEAKPVVQAISVVAGERVVRREKMSRMRKTISSRLVEAQQTAALLTTFNEVDMTAIMEIRKNYKEKFKTKYDVNLGFMSFFTKAAAQALMEFPIMNAQMGDNEIIYHDFADIGIAVSTPKGLVVPVVNNVEKMSFSEVESTILGLALKGRDGKLTPDDMTGGTFTITNGGTFGSMLSTPIVNRPQSAILGMHNIVKRPMAVNDEVKIRPIMYLAVTYDHRIIDGSDAVRFLVKIKELLEDPTRILLGL